MRPRIIARLDVKGATVVKGMRMDGLRVVGNARDMATAYYEQGADELLIVDVVASLYGRAIGLDALSACTESVFVPVTYCGGIRSVSDARAVLRAGADVIGLNTAAIARPSLLRELAEELGSSTVALQLDAKRTANGWEAYTDGGRTPSGRDAIEWALEAVSLGVGQVFATSIDCDGMRAGPDMELVRALYGALGVPHIAGGGIATAEQAAAAGAVSEGVCVGSALHYGALTVGELKGKAWAKKKAA